MPKQYQTFSILGDSYSTFTGCIPEGYAVYYQESYVVPADDPNWIMPEVNRVEQTWWWIFAKEYGAKLEQNNSFSGSSVCRGGYAEDPISSSFVNRVGELGSPELIIVEGGTNDFWGMSTPGINVQLGEYKFADQTDEELKTYKPALAKLLSDMKAIYPDSKIIFMLNSELGEELPEATEKICAYYDIDLLKLTDDVDKISGHPTIKGMKQISDQLIRFLNKGAE